MTVVNAHKAGYFHRMMPADLSDHGDVVDACLAEIVVELAADHDEEIVTPAEVSNRMVFTGITP